MRVAASQAISKCAHEHEFVLSPFPSKVQKEVIETGKRVGGNGPQKAYRVQADSVTG